MPSFGSTAVEWETKKTKADGDKQRFSKRNRVDEYFFAHHFQKLLGVAAMRMCGERWCADSAAGTWALKVCCHAHVQRANFECVNMNARVLRDIRARKLVGRGSYNAWRRALISLNFM